MTIAIGGLRADERQAPAFPAVSTNYVGTFTHDQGALAAAKRGVTEAALKVKGVLDDFVRTQVGGNAQNVQERGLIITADGNVQIVVDFTLQGRASRAYLAI